MTQSKSDHLNEIPDVGIERDLHHRHHTDTVLGRDGTEHKTHTNGKKRTKQKTKHTNETATWVCGPSL